MIRLAFRLAPLLIPVALAACGQPAPSSSNVAGPAKESGYIARVQALPQGQLEGVLFRAIQGGGGATCQGVDKVEKLPPSKGRLNWRVICPGDSRWLVSMSDDGTALVTGARGS